MRVLLMLILCGWISACSSTPEETSDYSAAVAADGGRQIVRTASLMLDVKEVEPAVEQVQVWLKEQGGYVASQNASDDEHAYLTCLVPAVQRESFMTKVKSLGKVISESATAEDITNTMTDTETELDNLYKLRDRMKALLTRAIAIDEVLSIEREINRIQSRIDYLEQTASANRKSVAMTKVSLSLRKHEGRGPLGWLFYGAFWTLGKLF